MASLLDRYDAMQKRPFGTNTALYRDPAQEAAGREYRREQSDFNMARRLLRREAGRGGATGMAAADRLLNMAPMAEERGVQYGGVQRAGSREATVAGRLDSRRQEMSDMELGRQAGRKTLADTIAAPATPRLDAGVKTPGLDSNPVRMSRPDPLTEGADSTLGITPRVSFAQADENAFNRGKLTRAEQNTAKTRPWWDR